MAIDNQSIIPKYYQLKELLLEDIRRNGTAPDSLLPSENELIGKYKVSRNTVRQAFSTLENEGFIYKVRGKGTFYKGEPSTAVNQSSLIGVITPVTYESIYLDIFNGIETYAHEKKYQIVLSNSMANPQKEMEVVEAMLQTGIAGLIIEPALSGRIKPDSYIFQKIRSVSLPVVVIDCWIEALGRPSVTLDDVKYGYLATKHLIDNQHRRIAYIYKEGIIAADLRKEGYQNALQEFGLSLDSDMIVGFEEEEERKGDHPAARITGDLMKLNDPPTAFFYFNDEYAVEGMQIIKNLGKRIPEDVSIIGIDDSYFATTSGVALTTLAHPKRIMGTRAAEMLISEIEAPGTLKAGCTMIEPELIERNTVSIEKSARTAMLKLRE